MPTLVVLSTGDRRETSLPEADVQRELNAGSTWVLLPGLSDDHAPFRVRATAVVMTVPTRTATA